MDKRALTATHWLVSRGVTAVLVAAAILFVVGGVRGRDVFTDEPGGSPRALSFALGAALLVVARLYWHVAQLRVQMAETTEALHQLLYGKDFRRDREAIDILLTAIENQSGENAKTAHAHLVRLTGQNFAADPKVWRTWWEANKAQFERKR